MPSWFSATARTAADGHRVSTFELFFDLVFVFGFTQITHVMTVTHTGLGVLQAMIMLGFLWGSWSTYGWLANQSRVDVGILRAGMIVAMCAVFVLALAVPTVFGQRGRGLDAALVFTAAYFAIRLVHILLYLVAARGDPALRRQVLRSSISLWVSVALMLTGSVVGGPTLTWFWLAGIVADILLTYLTSWRSDWRLQSAKLWSERHRLVILLALGESVVAIGEGAAHSALTLPILGGALLALILTTLLWWLYFDAISTAAERVLEEHEGRGRAALARDAYTGIHLLLIAGIVISALGVEEVMDSANSVPAFGLFASCALFGGTSLYLFAHAVFWHRVGGTWKATRVAGATVLLALIPVGVIVPSLAALGMVVVACGIIVAIESVRFAQVRRELHQTP
jgi:low temperature requirement protein LtrA